jgi:4-carboxymuconolactone decarboxylase
LGSAQRELYQAILEGPRGQTPQLFRLTGDDGALEGPFNAMLYVPDMGHALQTLGNAIRQYGPLEPRCREIAILVVAEHWDSAFERYAHVAIGRHVGLSEQELAAVAAFDFHDLPNPRERLVGSLALALARHGNLDGQSYGSAVAVLGEECLVALTTLVGYYALLALQLRTFGVAPPRGEPTGVGPAGEGTA